MKKILTSILFLLAGICLFGQNTGKGINYQAVARTTDGEIMAKKDISLQVILRKDGPQGKKVFIEAHYLQTTANGLFNLIIGQGDNRKGILEDVPWSESEIWMELKIDDTGGNNFIPIHSTRLMAVPYAFHALTADELTSGPVTKSSRATGLPFWTLIGNNNIDVENRDHFIGTRDSVDFVFKTNSEKRMVIKADGTLIFLGDVFFESNLSVGENLTVSENAFIGNNLQVDSSAQILVDLRVEQDLSVGRDATIDRNLRVDSTTSIGLDLYVERDALISRDLEVDSNATIKQDLFVRDSLQVDQNVNIGGRANIDDKLNVGDSLIVGGSADIAFDVNVGRDLNVIENVMVDRNIQVDTNAVIDQDLFVGRHLQVDTNATIGFDLYVRDSLQVDSSANIGLDLNVGRIATITDLLQTKDSLQVDSSANVGLDAYIGRNTFIARDLTVDSSASIGVNLAVGRIATIQNLIQTKDSLQVDSSANIGLDLLLGRDAFIAGNLQVDTNVAIGYDLYVRDSLQVDSIAIVGKDLFVGDSLEVNKVGIEQNLSVRALARLDSLMVTRGAVVNGGLEVKGQTSQKGLLDVSNHVIVGRNLEVTGDIIGSGNATVDSLVTRKSIVIENGNLLAKKNVNVLERFSIGALAGLPSNTGFFVNADAQKFDFPLFMQVIDSGYVFSISKQGQIFSSSGKKGIPTPGEFGDFGEKYGFWLESRDQGLYLQLSQPDLSENNNFINFADSFGEELGKITSDEDGLGINYASANGDYAEWLERADALESLSYGDVIGVKGGKISKNLEQADHIMVISRSPVVLGNQPRADQAHLYEKVGFMGQVPVKVRGQVEIGDYLLPDGNNNGIAKAVAPRDMQITDYSMIVGVAWEASSKQSVKYINTAIGINTNDLTRIIGQQQKELEKLSASIEEIQQVLGLNKTASSTPQQNNTHTDRK